MNVFLSPSETEEAKNLADITYAKWASFDGHYRNLWTSHYIGRLGEIAVLKFFEENGIESTAHFRNVYDESACDIENELGRFDVKTWNVKFWDQWGRAVSHRQLPYLVDKADAIIWCTDNGNDVVIQGWNQVSDFFGLDATQMGPENHKILNYQLPVEYIRNIDTLI